jgi:ABC-type bacteriocin/lantibiotic exporter with double-glycine peptidase domain
MTRFFENGLGRQLYLSRYRIALTYGLAIAASGFMFFYPLLTGWAIDDVLAGEHDGLLLLILVWACHLAMDYFRQRMDTITFSGIHSRTATEMIEQQRAAGVDTSVVAARSSMLLEITNFFAHSVPHILMFFISPIGALITLWLFDWWCGTVATIYALISLAFNRWIFPVSRGLHQVLNDRSEKNVSVIADTQTADGVKNHFDAMAKQAVVISNMEANVDAAMEVGRILLVMTFLWRLGQIGTVTAGEAYAMVSYVWRLTDGIQSVPIIVQQIARLSDIRKRIASGEELV